MIRNDRQYKISRARAGEFAELLETKAKRVQSNDEWSDVEMAAVRSQLDDLREEIDEYEKLKAGGISSLQINSLEELPTAIVKARIASGLTQKELADKLGVKEQQIQRYEQNDYAGVSIDRIQEIIKALNVSVKQSILLPTTHHTVDDLSTRLSGAGIDREFLETRLMPSAAEQMVPEGKVQAVAERLSRIYGWSPSSLLAGAPLHLPTRAIDNARFKLPPNVDEKRLKGYCIYAHYIALLALQATPHVRPQRLPTEWGIVRKDLLTKFRGVGFEAVLNYFWDLGIVVLPLFDVGLFHGACWRIGGRDVVVVKQRTTSLARWSVDLLHELYHLSNKPGTDVAIVEPPEGQVEVDLEDEEIDATDFAGDVLLDGRSDELAVICQRESKGRVEHLKNIVVKVAKQEKVDVGALANYMAFRLSQENKINWWGTAMNLQPEGPNPGDLVRAKLLANSDLTLLNEIDRDLFITAQRSLESTNGTNK
jgi:transcriptional regulator with XRE-family HTH domain